MKIKSDLELRHVIESIKDEAERCAIATQLSFLFLEHVAKEDALEESGLAVDKQQKETLIDSAREVQRKGLILNSFLELKKSIPHFNES